MNIRILIMATLTASMPFAANSLALELPPGAVQTAEDLQDSSSVLIPVGVFENGKVPMVSAEGLVEIQAWRIGTADLTTLEMITPLRQQLQEEGFAILLDCETEECGGFDFRFEINLLPEPEMHVDLGDYRYIAARRMKLDGTPEYISLTISRERNAGFVQMTRIGGAKNTGDVIVTSSKSAAAPTEIAPLGNLENLLATVGRAPLEDLTFQTGSSQLGSDEFSSLAELAKYLIANPDKSVALVGHTDAEGSLANNLALSKKRAASVVERLETVYNVPHEQLEAAGVGYLVPRASNLTEEGRDQNRRVEVILTSTR